MPIMSREAQMADQVPATGLQLRTLVTDAQTVELSLAEAEVPAPGPDQVIVRVEAAPINPSDLGLLLAGADATQAAYGGTPDRPVVTAPLPPGAVRAAAARVGQSLPAGNEGAGTVVAAGSSAAAQALLGKLVAVAGGGCTRSTGRPRRFSAWSCRTGPGPWTAPRRS